MIEAMRGIGTKEQEYEKARGAARDAEKQAGRTPLPPSPEHAKGATTDVTRGSLSRLKRFYNRDSGMMAGVRCKNEPVSQQSKTPSLTVSEMRSDANWWQMVPGGKTPTALATSFR